MSQTTRDALFIPEDFRKNFKNVIAKRSDLLKFARGRMVKPGSGSVVHYAGEVLGQITSAGPTLTYWAPYLSTNTDGTQIPLGILAESVEVDSVGNDSEIVIITAGAVFYDLLVGVDANAVTVLKAKKYVEGVGGSNIMEF